MANKDAACKNKSTALSILETITENMNNDTQRAALKAVAAWIQGNSFEDVTRLTREERQARIVELLTSERNLMTAKERKERAAFYLEGIGT
jgi:hypothetical protein